ncbi:hypothetical protein [Sphingomonas corticis]|jgi:hypothetical protein|uniref:DUF1648 domain-containing protein n=1 Tax=Sphingomonas corticis TaxID=2722791 RepID=A0ABX1CS29_9SPHN|nr:hypothetical protein [Sphingomonas corticis]NJR79458.1 hypothetical protein [Sphingomonas corticis]
MTVVAAVFVAIMGIIACRANARLAGESRLPMQWWFTGEVTWSAPRPVALAFCPALAGIVLGSQVVLAANVAPRPEQEDLVLPALIATGVLFVAIQLLHLWLIARTLRRGIR